MTVTLSRAHLALSAVCLSKQTLNVTDWPLAISLQRRVRLSSIRAALLKPGTSLAGERLLPRLYASLQGAREMAACCTYLRQLYGKVSAVYRRTLSL